MLVHRVILTVAAGAWLTITAMAQDQAAKQESGKEIKHVAVKQTSPASGVEMYKSYCAVCHGVDGTGNGPAASALKVAPTDLTALSAKNNGKYPSMRVASILRGEELLAAHGTKDMPIWGNLFWSMSSGHEAEVQQRVSNLNKYLESMQKK
ncbi:MAG TPA: c-type cytochrome [Terriglobales bacterium]|nr:c-type cytochrome [Terriglobales bacterium]